VTQDWADGAEGVHGSALIPEGRDAD